MGMKHLIGFSHIGGQETYQNYQKILVKEKMVLLACSSIVSERCFSKVQADLYWSKYFPFSSN